MKQSFTVIAIFVSNKIIQLGTQHQKNWHILYFVNSTNSATLKSAFSSYVYLRFLFLRSVIFENVEKKHSFHNKDIYIYESQTFWSFMKFYFVYILKVCFVFKKQSLCLYSSTYA